MGSLNPPAAADATRWFAAHELRTPLQGIQGGVALLLEERGAGLSALQLEALGLIAAATAELERCFTHLAELAALDATPAPPPAKLTLRALLLAPEQALGLTCGARLAARATLEVVVAPPLAWRALHLLTTLAQAEGEAPGLACQLEAIADNSISLTLAIAPKPSGDGAVVWHLTAALINHAGGRLEPISAVMTRLTLRRAPHIPISS